MKSKQNARLSLANARYLLPYWRDLFAAAAKKNLGKTELLRTMNAAWQEHAYPVLYKAFIRKIRKTT